MENSPPNVAEGQYSTARRRQTEAYEVIDTSEDEAFHTDLYDWYMENNNRERLLDTQSPYIVSYLQRRSAKDRDSADLLWRYHSRIGHNHEAADVQLGLARSEFALGLDERIEYLGRAKANASMPSPGVTRQIRYRLLREVSDLLDIANIQSDLLQRLSSDVRIGADRQPAIQKDLNGSLLPMSTVRSLTPQSSPFSEMMMLRSEPSSTTNTPIKPATTTSASSSTKQPTTAIRRTSKVHGTTSSTALMSKPNRMPRKMPTAATPPSPTKPLLRRSGRWARV